MPQTIPTVWEVRTYDVWGNARDGWEVNQSFSSGTIELDAIVKVWNIGTPHMFVSAELSNGMIRKALGINSRIGITVDGDDMTYYVNRTSNGYPIGELYCVSHDSLSPIRNKAKELANNGN